MTKIITLFSILFFVTFITFGQRSITAEEAINHYGETVTICDKIYGIDFAESSKNFTAVKIGDSKKKVNLFVFLTPEILQKLTDNGKTSLIKKSVCVTGKIRLINGLPEIVVNNSKQIYLLIDGGGSFMRPNDFMRFD